MKYITITAFIHFCLYAFASFVMLGIFSRLYLWLTPYDELKQIKEGITAPAIAFGGALLGFTFPLLSVSYTGVNFFDFLVWGVVAGALQLIAFKVIYWAIPMEIEKNNTAIATLYASLAVCVGLINAFSLIPQ